jgi:SNF2 family DNA or RNA helicase
MDYNVELTPEQERMYESLKQRAIAEIQNEVGENSIITVKIALTKMLRLHQFVCGHTKSDDGIVHEIPSNRLSALEAVLNEAQGKVVIWTSFTYDVKAISAFLEKKYGKESFLTYYGETSNEERERVKEVFKRGREVDSIKFLIANDKTGGYGNNFTAITTAVYYSYDFDNNVHHQTQDRIHRIGQTEPVTYVYLKAKGTIDEKILAVLKGKMTVAELITPSNWKENFL